MFGRVDDVPKHMVIWVATDWIIKEASNVLKKAGAHVAGAQSIGEAVSRQIAGDVGEKCIGIVGEHSGTRVSVWVLLDQVSQHCVECWHIGGEVGLQDNERSPVPLILDGQLVDDQ